jgi:hypothetical protein
LKKIRKFLKGWGYNIAGARKKRKQEIQEQILMFEEMEEAGPCLLNRLVKRLISRWN